jgi:ATP-binding cassette subfamily F protein 3
MTVLAVNQLSKSYGADIILDAVSLQIQPGERVGLIGPNGAGKTTLLKILTGQERADEGTSTMARNTAVGYLAQGTLAPIPGTMEGELRRAFEKLEEMSARLREMEEKMGTPGLTKDPVALEALMQSYGELEHSYEHAGGYRAEARFRAVTIGLGFSDSDLQRPVATFSGGERTRLQLARLLLEEPDLLLLDEPTNHLDISAVEWLEGYLRDWRGSVLIVSHDRYFLDRVVGRILSLEACRIKSYPGNYSAYLAQRELEEATLHKEYDKQQTLLDKEKTLIRTSGTGEREKRQAKSRQKRLDTLELVEKPRSEKNIRIDFGYSGRSGEIVTRVENAGKQFDGKPVFADANFELRWGDRIALVGPNGAGKSTLLKMIAKELEPEEGNVWLGPSVRMVYFDQHQGALSAEKTPLQEIIDASEMTNTEARTYLGRFLFPGDDVFKRNSELSGGERSRLALAKLGLEDGNFLVLDEPTNHLDISGVEELEKAIGQFPGTLLVVSHDRYFISRTTEKVLEVTDGSVRLYKMPYAAYVEERDTRRDAMKDPGKEEKRLRGEKEKEERARELAVRRERRKLELGYAQLEDNITAKEQLVCELEQQLALPEVFGDFTLAREKAEVMQSLKAELEEMYQDWEGTARKLES